MRSILLDFPSQLKWQPEVEGGPIPTASHYLLCGMGGSALGARMVDSLSYDKLRVPLEIFNDYKLPYYANSKTLVFLSSYSGSTEETINCFYESIKVNCKMFVISTGGKLTELAVKNNKPRYIINPINNPSKQPRMSIGYTTGAVLALLSKLGLMHLTKDEIDQAYYDMLKSLKDFDEEIPYELNIAKKFAKLLVNKAPILIVSEHLIGVAHTMKNQFNENAKTFSALFEIPELNHHLMEGLKYPAKLREIFYFLIINSKLYTEDVQKRYPITADVISKNGYRSSYFSPQSENKLSQVFETLIFGTFVNYYLTKDYDIDPIQIPWVDYFKDKLK